MRRTTSIRAVALSFILYLLCTPLFHMPAHAMNRLTVAVCPDLMPFHFLGEDGTLQGLHIDLLRKVAGLKNYDLEFVQFDMGSQAVAALENGHVDAVLGILPGEVANNNRVRFTDSLSTASVCMLMPDQTLDAARRGESQSHRYDIAFELGTVSITQLSQIPTSSTRIVGSQLQLYQALLNGHVDAVICVEDSMLGMLERDGRRQDYTVTVNQITNVDYSLLVRERDRTLLTSLNDAIRQLRASSTYNEIYKNWMVDLNMQDMQGHIRQLIFGIVVVAGIACVIIGTFFYMNYCLKVLVDQKTYELNQKVQQLEAASNLRNRLVEHSPGANMLVRLDGAILLSNSMARQMAGLSGGETMPDNIRDVRIFSHIWEAAAPLVSSGMDSPALISLGSSHGGRHTYRYQCHMTNTHNEVVLLVEDVTWEERRKQEQFEARKNQTLNRIIAGVAHEIKNPLMSIRTFSSLIYSQGDDLEFQRAFQEYVPKEVDRISRMIETLVNYARPPREHKELISVHNLVKSCAALSYLSSKKKIDIQYDVPEDAYLLANSDQLRQALVNLLINSIEAVEAKMAAMGPGAPERLKVQVTGYRSDGAFILEIYDQGQGMSEEDILQCTDPFFTTKKTGTGMGLALTKQYVRENDGQLEIESVLGQYTKMKLIFKEDTGDETHRMDH